MDPSLPTMTPAERIAAAEERRKAVAAAAAVVAEERLAGDLEALADAEEKAGSQAPFRVSSVKVADRLVVLVRALEVVWTRFRTASEKAGKNPVPDSEVYEFVTRLVAHPPVDELRALLADNPAAIGDLALEGAKLYGLKVKEDAGK